MTLWFRAECKASEGKSIHCSAYHSKGGVELERVVGLKLQTIRCHPGVTTVEDAKMEIAKWFKVPFASVKEVPF